jgi:hypothetical protein
MIKVKEDEMGWARSTNWKVHRLLVEKIEGKRQIRRSRRKWVDDIKMDLGKTEWGLLIGLD